MATPTKRRKTNNFKSSPQPVGSLDFFFQKQKNAASCDKTVKLVPHGEPVIGETVAAPNDKIGQDHDAQTLTDEDLARKLQFEWDAEDRDDHAKSGTGTGVAVGTASRDRESLELRKDLALDHRPKSPRTSSDVQIDGVATSNVDLELEDTKPVTLSLQSTASIRDTLSSTIPFDENPLTFDPSIYLANLRDHWAKEGGDAPYGLLTRCFILVNSTQSRIKIVDTLVNFLSTVIEADPDSLLPAVGIHKYSHILRYSKFQTGLASHECDFTALHLPGAWSGWFGNIKSAEKDMWLGQCSLEGFIR